MKAEETFKNHLQQAGERVTLPRLDIFRILARHAPVKPAVLMAKCQADGLDTVTVYRTLALFRRLGLLSEAGLGRNRLFELGDDYHAHHHHFACVACGTVTDFSDTRFEQILSDLGQSLGADVQSHQIELTGLCAHCKKRG